MCDLIEKSLVQALEKVDAGDRLACATR